MKEKWILDAEKCAKKEASFFLESCFNSADRLDVDRVWFTETALKELRKLLRENNFDF